MPVTIHLTPPPVVLWLCSFCDVLLTILFFLAHSIPSSVLATVLCLYHCSVGFPSTQIWAFFLHMAWIWMIVHILNSFTISFHACKVPLSLIQYPESQVLLFTMATIPQVIHFGHNIACRCTDGCVYHLVWAFLPIIVHPSHHSALGICCYLFAIGIFVLPSLA